MKSSTNSANLLKVTINEKCLEKISSASCTCPAGLTGRCSHVAAILFYIHLNISSTDVSCKWKERKDNLVRKTESK